MEQEQGKLEVGERLFAAFAVFALVLEVMVGGGYHGGTRER